ncbi:MAG: Zn-ribbon domain-containing OB-fold protein [Acidimicrobiia bacterium]|nr:Zn-ribbon domain-containing OB-fold protein [Acidimicrobiia bacterium]
MAEIQHPLPNASWETRGYWEGAGRGEIVLQRCRACGTVQHKPRGVCATCLSGDIEHFVASGQGTVYTFTVTNQNMAKGFAEACPYVMAYVTLEEGPRVLTNIVGCDPETVIIGMKVTADYATQERDDGEAFAVPRFTPV